MSISPVWGHFKIEPEDGSEALEMGVRHIKAFGLEGLIDPCGEHPVIASGPVMRGSGSEIEFGKEKTFRFNLSLRNSPTIFALVSGGWLPPMLVAHRILLLDRNVFHRLMKHSEGRGRWHDRASVEEILSSGAIFNPILCAHEGSDRREPSWDEYVAGYEEATRLLSSAFPHARLVDPSPVVLRAGYQTIIDVHDTYTTESRFLCTVSPLLVQPLKRDSRAKLEDALFQAATETGLPRSSLALVLALACLYESRDDGTLAIARRVLKPHRAYNRGDAHNSIADLRALQFAAMGIGMTDDGVGLCTADLGLAKLWCALGPSRGAWNGRRFDLALSVSSALLPALTEDEFVRVGARIATFFETAPIGRASIPN